MLSIARFCSILAVLLSMMIYIQAQAQSQGMASGATISGRITINGKPAPHVLVILGPSPLLRTKTNEEGVYRLSGVPEGRFTVEPVVPSFVVTEGPDSDQVGSSLRSNTGLSGFTVTIAQGDIREHIDFTLASGGVITGRVTDAEDKPMIAREISCYGLKEQDKLAGNILNAETDDRGIYRIYGLPAGKYLVAVSGIGRSAGRYHPTFYPDAIDRTRAKPVKVEAGAESSGIDIRVGQPEQSFVISGHVVDDATCQPVAGASIDYSGFGEQGSVTTDIEGRFEIKDCYPGPYRIWIATTNSLNKGYYSDQLQSEVSDSDVTDLEIKALRGANISGMVVVEGTVDPTIISKISQASLSATYLVSSEALAFPFDWKRGTYIAAGGAFEFTGLRPNKYEIRPINLPQSLNFMRIERDGQPVTDRIEVSGGEQVKNVRIVLAYGTGSIRGQLKIKGGNLPNPWGWAVEVKRADGEQIYYALLDASGYFWIKGLVPGSYDVTATIDYAEVPGVTPATHPPPITQSVMVENGTESQVSIVLDLSGKSKD